MTPRWFQGPSHAGRVAFWRSEKRFIFCHSGRRSWKTETAKRRLVRALVASPNRRFLAAAPTSRQAKRIFWEDFKKLIPNELKAVTSETEMFVRLKAGQELHVAGMDAPDRVEGQLWHGVLLDEYGNMAERVWPEVISPVLADTGGWAMLTGVPEGRNHYFDLIQRMRHRDDAAVFHWPSWEILPPEEIEVQRQNLDELTFAQEFGGEFVHFAGRAYYPFDAKTHCAPLRSLYDPRAPLVFCFDFNVDPGVAVICQERRLPSGMDGTAVLGEVFIPRNSNTEIVSRKIIADWGTHEGRIHLYGDFTGGNRGSSKLRGSDWDIILNILGRVWPPGRLHLDVPPNPPVRRRINAVNARLKSMSGDIRLMIDPAHAPNTVKDFEGVTLIEGSAGEINKKDGKLSHLSDALGYYIARVFPIAEREATLDRLY